MTIMKFKHSKGYIGLAIILLICSCTGNTFFEQNEEIKTREWDLNNPVVLKVNIEDTVSAYDLYVNLRNSNQYRYSNLYIFMTTTYPDHRIEKDTLDLTLAADDGRWKGSGLGDLYFNQFLFADKVKFVAKGEYTFQLVHGMRINPLPGIADVGLRIEKSPSK